MVLLNKYFLLKENLQLLVYNNICNNKLIIIEFLFEGKNILNKKGNFISKNFKNKYLENVILKLNNNTLNTYFRVIKVMNGRVEFKLEELYSVKNKKELIEILILMFQNMSEFEICESLLRIIK